MAEEARSPRQDTKGVQRWPPGYRRLSLHRSDHGFGFTLRHFIVYPPESYMVLAGDGRLGMRPGALDTIFVKHVKPGSPAECAGLHTGDRVVSVNREAIIGHTYASVVHKIHNSGHNLQLEVVPQEDDILQLYFNETAHRPESNLQVAEPPMVRSGGGGCARRSLTPADSNDSVYAAYSNNIAGCRLSLDAGLIGRRDSTSHEGSASSLGDHSSDDSVIISRIRKSFEQKEEFLKRPAGPLWPSNDGPPPGIKEFYARPQKLQPPPHWPPNIPNSPNHSPTRKEREDTPPRERGFVCGGPVTNAPCDRRLRPGFVTTLGRIHETIPPCNPPPPQHQMVSQRARQFESGSMPDRTNLYRSELSRLSNKHMVPDVSVRAREFESKSDRRNRESRSLDSGNLPTLLSGNRLVPVGGRILHCEPPLEHQPHSYDENLRPRSNSAESAWLDDLWPQRHKAVRQDSYLAACHKPSLPPADSPSVKKTEAADAQTQNANTIVLPSPTISIPQILIEPIHDLKPKTVVKSILSPCKSVRPNTLDIPTPIHPCPPTAHASCSFTQECGTSRDPDGSGTDEDSNSTPLGSPGIVWRDKSLNDTGSEEDRMTRRVSYLKATWPDRMHVDSDPDVSDSEPPVSGLVPRHSLCEDLSLPDKENHHITHEGSLHCKLTIVDGKRATDRSWKQVWAVLRGPVLCLYKERRDSLPLPDTPEGAEASSNCGIGEQVDVRCAQVGTADNYTKRKHVLRLNTHTGSELLLQAPDATQMARWLVVLEEQANNNNTQNASGTSLSPASTQKGLRKLTSLRNRSPTGQSPVNKTRKPSQQVEPVSSPKSKTWKGRVAKQFRRIQHSGSPVSPTSPHQPHVEGATIGIPLEDCPPSTTSEYVPLLVEVCTGIVEKKGLEVIGIYRVPGNTAAVSSLTEAVNREGLDTALLDQDQRWTDVNVISSLLKSFFRRLPDSLLTSELYPSFIRADKITDPHLRMATIRKLVHDLPDYHYETLKYLLLHLKKVVEHAAMNKMEARNLAIVFGPTLVRTADDNMVTMVTDMSHQCRIVETLILHVDWCFGDETVERLTLEGEGGMEPDPAVPNHNLLLGNIHKVEGMTKELSARDIVSSIICAANRKMMKTKSRKSQPTIDTTDHASDTKQKPEGKNKTQHRKERLASTEESSTDSSQLSTKSLYDSVNLSAVGQPTSQNDNVAVGEEQGARPQVDSGTIRTYAGLSATTQERIRRFELETKAMLHRETARMRRPELDSEREQGKRELETDDHVNPSAIVKKIAEPGRAIKPLAIVPPSTEGRGRSRHKEEGAAPLRRGSSAENVNLPPPEKQANGNLKRFKSGKEQREAGLGRCGSLDSLHDLTPSERPPSHISDEGGDLLVSLTSTFDAKLRSLLSSGVNELVDPPSTPHRLFTDPSLHKSCDKEGKEEESKEECCVEKDKSKTTNLLTNVDNLKETANITSSEPRAIRLYRSESVNKDERVCRSESLSKSDSFKLRRSESLNKEARSESNSKLKRSDSLTKNEKTESNLNKRRQLEASRWNMVKLKRKTGSAIDRSIKRRHTVGGTKDFDKVNWLDNRQREAEEEGKNERRTSSPDLSSSRLATVVILRPHSFAEPNLIERLCGIPLESHV